MFTGIAVRAMVAIKRLPMCECGRTAIADGLCEADIVSRVARGVVCIPDGDRAGEFDCRPLASRMWCRVASMPGGRRRH